MGHRLRILHISDLHIRGDWEKEAWRRSRVLGDAWKRNLDEVAQDGPVDLVAFTGDLAFSGRRVEYEGVGQFLDEVLSRLKCPRERLFLVPGNHDVDRSIARTSWKKLRALLRPDDAQEFSQWMASPKEWAPRGFRAAMRDEVLSRQSAYREWVGKELARPGLLPSAGLHPRLGYRETLHLPGRPFAIHVIGLDSAWLAGDEHDSGRLWLTDDQVMRLATEEGQQLAGVRLALIHHPLDQLMDGAHARLLLAKHADVLLRGHLHEAEAMLLEEPSSGLRSLAAGCLYESDRYPNSCQLLQLTVDDKGRLEACEVWFRSWSRRGHWYSDDSLYPGTSAGRLRWGDAAPREASLPPRTGLFVGRAAQLQAMEGALLPAGGAPVPVAIQGMPGVGKSYLVGHFYREHAGRFPGGFHRLTMQPGQSQDAEALLRVVADRVNVTAGPAGLAAEVRETLRLSSALLVIDNVDGLAEATAAAEVVRRLAGCAVVVSGRLQGLGDTAGWVVVPLRPLEASLALEQLSREYRAARGRAEEEGFARLVRELGYLPLAIHLAAGYLRRGTTVGGFLAQLRRKGLAVGPVDKASELLSEGATRAVLRTSLELSLKLLRTGLREEWGEEAPRFLQGIAALGHAPAAGVGRSLGAALAGLSEDEFGSLVVQAAELSILEKVPEEEAPRQDTWRVHPLLAVLLQENGERETVINRMTEWFTTRFLHAPSEPEEQGRRWTQVALETPSLVSWLPQVPVSAMPRVVIAGAVYAQFNGPFLAWAAFAESALLQSTEPEPRSLALLMLARMAGRAGLSEKALAAARELLTLARSRREASLEASALDVVATLLQARGEVDEALRVRREEELPIYKRLGDVHSRAVTLGTVAGLLEARGELDEALRLLREDVLPVFGRMGDAHSRAVTLGKVAGILEARGERDEALRLLREEVVPVYERLGDARSQAAALGHVAGLLEARGELDEALRLLREDVLPVFERLGDVRSRAMTLAKLADILDARGEWDEALRLLREEVVPVFERLGDVRLRAMALGEVADILQARGELDEALRLLREEELPVYERLGDVRSWAIALGQVADIFGARGELDEALRLLREDVLPVFERMGDVHSRAVSLGKMADILQARGELDEALRLLLEEVVPVYERLGDVRSQAMAQGLVADILLARGELDKVRSPHE
jgi:tetratricopeptide (TPR) repeat protein